MDNVPPSQIGHLVMEGGKFGASPCPSISINVRVDDLDKKSGSLADDAKKLSKLTVSQYSRVLVFIQFHGG